MSWLQEFTRARSNMLLLQDQQLSLGPKVLSRFPRPSVPRVFQLDGERLEQELVKILRSQVGNVFAVFKENWRFRFQEELDLVLSLLLCKFTFWNHNAFYGDQLQNMIYRSEAKALEHMRGSFLIRSSITTPSTQQKLLKLILSVLVPYIFNKAHRKSMNDDWASQNEGTWQYKLSVVLSKGEVVWQTLSLINHLIFLKNGVYRNAVDRVLQLRLVNDTQRMNKVVNLSYMNQQVYWSVVFSFVSVVLPLMRLNRLWSFFKSFRTTGGGSVGGDGAAMGANTCCACGTSPICMPHTGECMHRFCYVCISGRMGIQGPTRGSAIAQQPEGHMPSDGGLASFNCPVCGVNITQISPAS